MVYYTGSLLLLFVPGVSMARGGAAAMIKTVYQPETLIDYRSVVAAIAISGSLALALLSPAVRVTVEAVNALGRRRISVAGIIIVTALVFSFTGAVGIAVMFTASGIGMIPPLFGSRRMNCLGVILVPVAIML